MTTIVRGRIPAEEFALYEARNALSEAVFDCEHLVATGDDTIMPLLWVQNVDSASTVEEALAADPTVDNLSVLASFEDEHLCRMDWVESLWLALQMVTNSQATILDAYNGGGPWHLRVFYPSRDSLSRTTDFADENDLTFHIDRIREIEGEPSGRFGLTDDQFRALVTAHDMGYYEVPRSATLEDVADELGVSHQALSERLRRGYDALIEDALRIGGMNRR